MATIVVPVQRRAVSKFYVMMAVIFVAIAFGGFFATYWLQLARGTFTGSPMLHLHGLLFSLWTLFFLSQAMLMANGRRTPTGRSSTTTSAPRPAGPRPPRTSRGARTDAATPSPPRSLVRPRSS